MKVIPPLALLFSLAALAISLIQQPENLPRKNSLSTGRLEARIRSLENELAELANATRQPVNEFQDPLTNQSDSDLPLNSTGNTPTKIEQQLRDLGVLEHFRKQKAKLAEARSIVLDSERDQIKVTITIEVGCLHVLASHRIIVDHSMLCPLAQWVGGLFCEARGDGITS